MKTVSAILFSAYKHKLALKWLAGCDPIGCMNRESISQAHGGSCSNPAFTQVSEILASLPFGSAVKVDKGFLIENLCALLGIICVRPMKHLEKQTQQSSTDTGLTQKVGKTRIPIEQCNGGMKNDTAFFDHLIKIQQNGLADRIFFRATCFRIFHCLLSRRGAPTRPRPGARVGPRFAGMAARTKGWSMSAPSRSCGRSTRSWRGGAS